MHDIIVVISRVTLGPNNCGLFERDCAADMATKPGIDMMIGRESGMIAFIVARDEVIGVAKCIGHASLSVVIAVGCAQS